MKRCRSPPPKRHPAPLRQKTRKKKKQAPSSPPQKQESASTVAPAHACDAQESCSPPASAAGAWPPPPRAVWLLPFPLPPPLTPPPNLRQSSDRRDQKTPHLQTVASRASPGWRGAPTVLQGEAPLLLNPYGPAILWGKARIVAFFR